MHSLRSGTSGLDLSHEVPTLRAEVTIQRETIPGERYVRLGHAAVFLDGAAAYMDEHPTDVDAIVGRLGADKVHALAIVFHPPTKDPIKRRGWHNRAQGMLIKSGIDQEIGREFTNVAHVMLGGNKNRAHTILHEAGHIYAHEHGLDTGIFYTPQHINRVSKIGLIAAGVGVACTIPGFTQLLDISEGLGAVTNAVLGVAGFCGGLLGWGVARNPDYVYRKLWQLSPAERHAERFAKENSDLEVFVPNGNLPPDTQLAVSSDRVTYTTRLHL
jgi:hypothetical protein